ncbi:ZN646 protein, partial [Syrrhaptes paradoxus]|nr:ZN646 protein [Syrrhaptes paradoxus]
PQASPRRLYGCAECGRRYRHRGSLSNHRRSHRPGAVTRPRCPQTVPDLPAWRRHARPQRHDGSRPAAD